MTDAPKVEVEMLIEADDLRQPQERFIEPAWARLMAGVRHLGTPYAYKVTFTIEPHAE